LKEIANQFKKFGKIPAGYLIESCGLKGKRIGGAEISKQHANFIVNINKAKAEDVLALINLCKKEVKRKFGIGLQEEIRIVAPQTNSSDSRKRRDFKMAKGRF